MLDNLKASSSVSMPDDSVREFELYIDEET